MERWRIEIRGVVQGVGLRPWLARRASALGLAGRVRNTGAGVVLALEGAPAALGQCLTALRTDPPVGARVESLRVEKEAPLGERGFRIEASDATPVATGGRIPPDVPVCDACLAELFDPGDRRHRYPFTHCASCGPRAAVLEALPFDRERTSLARFAMCRRCAHEYGDPAGRRHHAQTLACPDCGPQLVARTSEGAPLASDPIERAAEVLSVGGCVALLGYGGFHLLVDATRPEAVERLRKRKARPAKPFALLVPDLASARRITRLGASEEALLAGPERAVVVAPRRRAAVRRLGIAEAVAPRTDDLGLLLPATPAQWLLLHAPGSRPGRDAARFAALVCTSGNRSGEPVLWDPERARAALADVADLFVEHDRAVLRPNDDPVFRAAAGHPIPIRLSRGTAPRVLAVPPTLRGGPHVVALGGDLKCAPALACRDEILLAEHVGDLAWVDAADALEDRLADLVRLVGAEPACCAHDLHPGYASTALARGLGWPCEPVQHHHAHAAACLVEHGHDGPALALALDGAGWGPDGTMWGGELLRVDFASFERLAHLEAVRLPGGDAAAREPWRMTAAWLRRAFPAGAPALPWHARRDPEHLRRVRALAESGPASPLTSSCGRLFDAVASLLDLVDEASYEAEAALALESLAAEASPSAATCAPAPPPPPGDVVPLADLVRWLALEHAAGTPRPLLARAFHLGLAGRCVAAACRAAEASGLHTVALTGGCFQNRLLLEEVERGLASAGLEPLGPLRIPPGDGGLAVGQAAVALARALGRRA